MKVDNNKLTSVHVLEDIYKKFKVISIDGNINLQKLVNRSLDLYVKDLNYRSTINNYTELATTGSKY
jgi:aminoglycoside N3'-acetyltransferase